MSHLTTEYETVISYWKMKSSCTLPGIYRSVMVVDNIVLAVDLAEALHFVYAPLSGIPSMTYADDDVADYSSEEVCMPQAVSAEIAVIYKLMKEYRRGAVYRSKWRSSCGDSRLWHNRHMATGLFRSFYFTFSRSFQFIYQSVYLQFIYLYFPLQGRTNHWSDHVIDNCC